MPVSRKFKVFGEPVEILVASEESGKSFAVLTQVSPPGGGPPPHRHSNEDEIFTVLEGEYEIFDGETWHKLHKGETAFTLRGGVHTFRNCGATAGKMQAVIVPGAGLDDYLEAVSVLSVPQDMEKLEPLPSGLLGGVHLLTFATDRPPSSKKRH